MNRSFSARVRGLLQRRTLKSRLASLAKVVSCVAVFCISYILVAPVITEEWEPICGMEEHVHTAECYQEVWVPDEVDTDNDDNSDNIENIENDIENESTEPQTETQQVLTCDLAEGHTHDSGCYERVQGDLICTVEGTEEEPHEHDDSCYDWTEELVCTETEGHTHDESCYETVEVEVEPESQPETKPVESEEQGGESGHYETVLVCELPEHTHNDSCYHISDDENKAEYVCGFATNHTHTADCYFENGDLKCTVPEHIHTDKCLAEDAAKVDKADGTKRATTIDETFEYEDDFVKATVKVQGNVFLPEIQSDDNTDAEDQAVENETVDNETAENGETADAETVENDDETAENIEDNAAETSDDHNGLELVVTESDSDEKYTEFTTLAEEDGEIMMLQVLDYSLMMGDEEISLDACTVDVQVEAKAELQQMMDAPIASSMYALESDDETAESESNEADADIMMELASFSDNDGSMAYVVLETDNPSFTVQYYAWLERAVRQTLVGGVSDFDAVAKDNKLVIIDTDNGSDAENSNKGGLLPKNGKGKNGKMTDSPNDNELAYLKLEKGVVKTDKILTEIYKNEELTYKKAPGLMYFNIVNNNEKSKYSLKEIWVLKDKTQINRTEDSTGWKTFTYSSKIRFTNREQTALTNPEEYILIDKDAVIRLVYEPEKSIESKPAHFYDYDITDGKIYATSGNARDKKNALKTSEQGSRTGVVYANTLRQGINSSTNYSGKGAKLAFGNGNTGTGMWEAYWKDEEGKQNAINVLNRNALLWGTNYQGANSFRGCAFGIAKSLNDGKIQYANGIDAPKLFNEGSATGKRSYTDGQYSLEFNRVGDTFTLSAVKNSAGEATASNLYKFAHPTTAKDTIWTNNFWPMDSAPSHGTNGHDLKFGQIGQKSNRQFVGTSVSTFPIGDDEVNDHNAYFGMQYSVTFDLSSSYVGPLEYFFFGDDDMWVFLTPCDKIYVDGPDGKKVEQYIPHYEKSELVCDLGGVHLSVGEYVNLWDYINRGELLNKDGKPLKTEMIDKDTGEIVLARDKDGKLIQQKDENGNLKFDAEGNPVYEPKMTDVVNSYMLSFFYTERGASGSTCWMQFTLPTVAGVNLESVLDEQIGENTGSISIRKNLEGIENNKWFEFTIEGLKDNFKPSYYQLLDANGELIPNDDPRLTAENGYIIGGTDNRFRIRAGDVLALKEIPGGTELVVTEIGEKGENGASLDGYQSFVTVNGVEQNTAPKANATIVVGKRTEVVYTNVASYELPATGGMGTHIFYIVGSALCLTALALAVVTNRRKESEN